MHNIAIDIGTSGIRAQLLETSGEVVRTCITTRNPIPGSNVMDHMTFALERGLDVTHGIMIDAIQEVISRLDPGPVGSMAVCGNPIQLSIFESTDVRDLAFAGDNKLKGLGVERRDRDGHMVNAEDVGLPYDADIIVPPAVRHEIGADALAMMIGSGFLDSDRCMVTDYGTNAEMALKVGDEIYTGSAAAGPALEGQNIGCGMLAGPGAMCDLERTPRGWRAKVLDGDLEVVDGPMVNLRSDITTKEGVSPSGITGTGVVALVYAALKDDRVRRSRIDNDPIRICRNVSFRSADYIEAGKAIGAIRAGHMTLMHEAGASPGEIRTMFMAGASGTYVDPVKAMGVGMVVPHAERVVQVGNTSLELARNLVTNTDLLDDLNDLKSRLRAKHVMFASSDIFSQLYVNEIGMWSEGMPDNRYRSILDGLGLCGYLDDIAQPVVEKVCRNDIRDIGSSMGVIDPSISIRGSWECSRCGRCIDGCPEGALTLQGDTFRINTGRCLGTACLRCEQNCPERKFKQSSFVLDD